MIKEVIIDVAIFLALIVCVGAFRDRQCHGGDHGAENRSGSTSRP